ncbi:gamma-glutamyltranspeptidase / glutathione hydrolase [Rhizobiales bacterium GAS188]|nr:gamma-glutamyltranspeptidase / glutathione hydrolase [Rhizobiales bacterium GAS188]
MDGKRPTVASVNGIVAAAHPLAALAGVRLLAEGGNAFDAAAATAAALNVVEPYMSGLAGMGTATCRIAAEKRIRTLDYVTRVPSHFPQGRFKERAELARGAQGCGTPGNLAGWCELVRSHGRKTLSEVFAPAIGYARDGFPLAEYNVSAINEIRAELKASHAELLPDWAALYASGRERQSLGDVLRQPALARTFEAIASEGPAYLYGGPLGRAVVAQAQRAGGCLSEADLEAVEPRWVEPIAQSYRGLAVHSAPPPSESYQYLLTLRILEGFDFSKLERNGVEHLDIVYRAIRLAAGVRIATSNPDAEQLRSLLGDAHVETLRQRVRDGRPVEGPTEQFIAPQPVELAHEHTTSFSVADRDGNAVCITQSLGALFGCGVVVPEHGVCLNNFLYWGEVAPGGRNHLTPNAELALPLAPSIATSDGELALLLGTPGSYGICQTQTQVMVQHLDYGLGLQDAIEAPRARLWDGRRVQIEARLPDTTYEALRKRGHEVDTPLPWTMAVGGMHGITRNPQSGAMAGACDPRRDGYVAAL